MAEENDPITTASNPRVGPLERVRHLKRGTEYEVLGEAEAQVARGELVYTADDEAVTRRHLRDGNRLTVYRCASTGKLWARFTDEFRDGRFETIPSAPSPEAGAGGDLGAIHWRKPEEAPENRPVLVAGGVAVRREGAWYSITGEEWPGRPIQWEVVAWAELPRGEDVALISKTEAFRSGKLVASTGSGEETKGADDVEQRINNLHAARQSALRQMNEQAARAEAAEKRCIELERGAIHPALALDVQQHRDEAYRTGWDDGYAEGFAKALAPSDAPSTTEADR